MKAFYDITSEQRVVLCGAWNCAYSGGKDSTSLVTWIEWLRRTERIIAPHPQLVQTDTAVEDPKLNATSRAMRRLLESCGWECAVVMPSVHERLYPQILGRGLPPIHPGVRRLRWCTRSTKIDPMNRWLRQRSAGLTLTGLRLGESAIRDEKLKSRGCSAGGECGIPDADERTYSPIIQWTTCQVIDWLNGQTEAAKDIPDIVAITKELVAVYGMKIGQPSFSTFGEPEIRSARFGCTGCPAIGVGPEAPRSVVSRYGEDSPLNELYEIWHDARKAENRLGKVKSSGKWCRGPLKMAVRKVLFERVMDIQGRAGVVLITPEDEAFIRRCWENKVYPRGWSEADESVEPPSDITLFDGCKEEKDHSA